MNKTDQFEILVLPGDGIGTEIVTPCLDLLRELQGLTNGFDLRFDIRTAGAEHYLEHGESMSLSTMEAARKADAILLGAMGLPDVRYPNGTEISPQLELRESLHLFAGTRPIKPIRGLSGPLRDSRAGDIDFVLVRESTEGMFASRNKPVLTDDERSEAVTVITRTTSELLFDYAFELARRRKENGHPGRVTCVEKSNVLGVFAFFRKIFFERAERYPDIVANAHYVDAAGLNLVRRPWDYDVLVTENMFGDILSDVSAGLIGGMGVAPSGDIGLEHAVFQPAHGSAPDIAGQGIANPVAMVLSAAMMLDWLGQRHSNKPLELAAQILREAVQQACGEGACLPHDFGGSSGTEEIYEAISQYLIRAQYALAS